MAGIPFEALLHWQAGSVLGDLNKPLTQSEAASLINWIQDIQSKGKSKRRVDLPIDVRVLLSFVVGQNPHVIGDELWVETIGSGHVLLWKWDLNSREDYSKLPPAYRPKKQDPVYIGYFDVGEEKIYFLNPERLASKGLFGQLYTQLLKHTVRHLVAEQGQVDRAMQAWKFYNLPDEKRTKLAFIAWCVVFNSDRVYAISEKEADIQFEVEMRQQLGISEVDNIGKDADDHDWDWDDLEGLQHAPT
jgi:hypothetical protein